MRVAACSSVPFLAAGTALHGREQRELAWLPGSWEIVGTDLSEVFENEDPAPFLEHVNGILVPAASASAAR